jgi:hypothetical protein
VTEGKVIVPNSGPPDDSLEDTVCPLRSTTAVGQSQMGIGKVSADVPCRRQCMFFVQQGDKGVCAVTLIAMSLADRA